MFQQLINQGWNTDNLSQHRAVFSQNAFRQFRESNMILFVNIMEKLVCVPLLISPKCCNWATWSAHFCSFLHQWLTTVTFKRLHAQHCKIVNQTAQTITKKQHFLSNIFNWTAIILFRQSQIKEQRNIAQFFSLTLTYLLQW